MCIIAGYSGKETAAPILIEMLKKTEYIDGALSTGIATTHEGKLYTRKVLGDVDTLLRETDALSLPGTTGIIHSRTGNDYLSHAHPFTSEDEELALVLNGTSWGCGNSEFYDVQNAIMDGFLDRGIKIKSAVKLPDGKTSPQMLKNGMAYHDTEPYALIIGDAVKNSPSETIANDIARAAKDAIETLPLDIINLSVHARLPDTITVATVTRPMAIGYGDGETYLATCAIAFPEEIASRPVTFLPPTTVAQATPSGLKICSVGLKDTRVEQIDYRVAKKVREDMERVFGGKKDNPQSIYALPLITEWDNMWQKPLVDSKYVLENSRLKPIGPAIYEGLWSFYKEGRLHMTIGPKDNKPGEKITKFWIE